MLQNLALTLMFDGSRYHGWQRQTNAVTVEEVLSNAIYKRTGRQPLVIGCSRTDAGVHAIEYICNFMTDSPIPPEKLPFALNTLLPYDIRVLKCNKVSDDFHSRFCAVSKTYVYNVYTDVISNPFLKNFAFHFPYTLNLEQMQRAATYFIGEYDFSAFMTTGSSQKTTVRKVTKLTVTKKENFFRFEISANAFLYNMVRIIVGTLLYVGMGKISENDITKIIKSRDRSKGGITAGAMGLYLAKVDYNDEGVL
ncbi:MAG: tRNA pseudouridine(38-40) synthase TruA [Firmicutes bacterium]|nr:tRNA pseudouridine(38-40) synthase TruA [Bacillota bacterium]